jgi:hypothetical protein
MLWGLVLLMAPDLAAYYVTNRAHGLVTRDVMWIQVRGNNNCLILLQLQIRIDDYANVWSTEFCLGLGNWGCLALERLASISEGSRASLFHGNLD